MAKHQSPRPDPKDLEKFGPRIDIVVGSPIIGDKEKRGVGKFARMPALIDSGAGRTVLTPEVIKMLSLPLVDYTTVSRAGGTDRVGVHVVSIQFSLYKMASIDVIQVVCCDLPGGLIQCLIGRDILARWLFTYHGQTGEWSIDEGAGAGVLSPLNTPLTNPPWVEPPSGTTYDVFVCHASEDKEFVDALASALKAAGISVWYDKDRIQWGDNIRTSIDQGLLGSRFGIVVFSKAFLKRKRWTEHELNGLFAKEKPGEARILPLLHGITLDDLAEYSPGFVDRSAMDSQRNSIEEIVRNMKSRLERHSR